MRRVYAGTDVAEVFELTATTGPFSAGFSSGLQQSAGGEVTSTVFDPLGRLVRSSASLSGDTATVTISRGDWIDGASGYARIQVTRTVGLSQSIQVSERIRVLPGMQADRPDQITYRDYA